MSIELVALQNFGVINKKPDQFPDRASGDQRRRHAGRECPDGVLDRLRGACRRHAWGAGDPAPLAVDLSAKRYLTPRFWRM